MEWRDTEEITLAGLDEGFKMKGCGREEEWPRMALGCASRGMAWLFSEMGSPGSGTSFRDQGWREEGHDFGFQHIKFQDDNEYS